MIRYYEFFEKESAYELILDGKLIFCFDKRKYSKKEALDISSGEVEKAVTKYGINKIYYNEFINV